MRAFPDSCRSPQGLRRVPVGLLESTDVVALPACSDTGTVESRSSAASVSTPIRRSVAWRVVRRFDSRIGQYRPFMARRVRSQTLSEDSPTFGTLKHAAKASRSKDSRKSPETASKRAGSPSSTSGAALGFHGVLLSETKNWRREALESKIRG